MNLLHFDHSTQVLSLRYLGKVVFMAHCTYGSKKKKYWRPCVVMQFRTIHFIHSIGMCRIRRFLAFLRSFFHSSLLCSFSCHPSPPTTLPSPSCHLFLVIPLNLVVPKFIYNTLLGILFSSILSNQRKLFNRIVSYYNRFFNTCINFFIG